MKLESLSFRDRFGILSEKRLSGVAELRYVMVYGKSQFMEIFVIMKPTFLTLCLIQMAAVFCFGADMRFETTAEGRISKCEVKQNEQWSAIPFRTDEWGTSWYVRNSKGDVHPVPLSRSSKDPNLFTGSYQDVQFGLSYAVDQDKLLITATLANQGNVAFQPMSAGVRIGFNSYQEKYPDWNNKPIPNVMRCEPTHHWGFAMSPDGAILGWVCPDATASYSINYQPSRHRIYTANIDFINQMPLPNRHPQNLHSVGPGEAKKWTVMLLPISDIESVKSALSAAGEVPIFDAKYYTIRRGGETRLTVLGPKVKNMYMALPLGGQVRLKPVLTETSKTEYIFNEKQPGLYTLRAECENGKIAEGSIFVRHDWKWYLEKARIEGLRVKPTQTHHAECVSPFYSYFLAKKYVPNAELDVECEKVFQEYFPQHYDFEKKKLKVDSRIQDTAVWAGILADRFAVTDDEKDLEIASNLVDFLVNTKQGEDGGFYAHAAKTHYTSVIYLAKSIMEVLGEEKKLALKSPIWKERYERHRRSVDRAIDDLARRGGNVETEGQQTFEDGMISCTLTQLAMYALKTAGEKDISKYVEAAEELAESHRSLTLSSHPDARVNGATIRFWETQYTICLMHNMYNSPCGWSAWKLYGNYYLYLLTGKEEYLVQTFNGLGACVQLIDWQSGRLRWGFTPDPFIYAKWAAPAKQPDDKKEHDWVVGVRGEEYLEQISDWNRSKPIWRKKWGIDNFAHEIFKCMEEVALCNAYVIERQDGTFAGYNCTVKSDGGIVTVDPIEETTSRIHLNLSNKTSIKARVKGEMIEGDFVGMQWIGPGGTPEDLRPM